MDRYIDRQKSLLDKVAFHWVGNDPADKGQVVIDSQVLKDLQNQIDRILVQQYFKRITSIIILDNLC